MSIIINGIITISIFIAVFSIVVYAAIKIIFRLNSRFDLHNQLLQNNSAAGILMASILVGTTYVVFQNLNALKAMVELHMVVAPHLSASRLGLSIFFILGLFYAILIAAVTTAVILVVFGKLLAGKNYADVIVNQRNIAVSIVLATIIVISSMFVGTSTAGLIRSVMPQIDAGQIEIAEG